MTHLILRATAGAAVLFLAVLALAGGSEPATSGKLPSDLALVPPGVGGFVTIGMSEVESQPLLAPFKGQLFGGSTTLAFAEKMGIKLADIERVTLFLNGADPERVLIFRTTKPYDRKAILEKLGRHEEKTIRGKEVHVLERPGGLLRLVDERTLVIATERAMADLPDRPGGEHPLAEELKAAADRHTLVVGLRPSLLVRQLEAQGRELRKRMEEKLVPKAIEKEPKKEEVTPAGGGKKLVSLEEALEMIPPEAVVLCPLLCAERMLLTADLGKELAVSSRLVYSGADEAKDGLTGMQMMLLLARELLPRAFRLMGLNPKEKPTAGLMQGLLAALRAAEVARDGTTVQANLKMKADLAAIVPLLTEQMLHKRDANNFKQIALALINYSDAYGTLPGAAIVSKDGKPLLSWRVTILPFVEEQALYNQFHLDEPWDSPHNRKLLTRMPKVYAAPAETAPDPGSTYYQVFVGPNTPFHSHTERKGPAYPAMFPDGTSNTILVAEAGRAVPWTKPEDIAVEAKKPLPKLGRQFKKFFHAAFADGSVQKIRRDFDADVLRVAIDPADGMILELEKLKP
jgi:hypothetical protein